ncbi:hypothetical protein pEaSNUABM54_00026 [Erwinia phage pEa_SNUABM_54]|nr:hypothetical protein pEaSNUABM54_00026 [Erwinia phage pEa_SNUABM_54]
MIDVLVRVLMDKNVAYLSEQNACDTALLEKLHDDILGLVNNTAIPVSCYETGHTDGVVEFNFGTHTVQLQPAQGEHKRRLIIQYGEGTVARDGTRTGSLVTRKIIEWLDLKTTYGGEHRLNVDITGTKLRIEITFN